MRLRKITAVLLCLTLVFGCVINNSSTLAAENGWVTNEDGTRSYYEGGEMVCNTIKEIDGAAYYFDSSGKMLVNTTYHVYDMLLGYWIHAKEDGTLCCSEWYDESYFGDDYIRYETGFYEIGERYYYFESGVVVKEDKYITENGKLYQYKHETGERIVFEEGFNTVDGDTYYVKDGAIRKNCKELIDGKYYAFDDSGILYVDEWFYLRDYNTFCFGYACAKEDGSLYHSEFYNDGLGIAYFGEKCTIPGEGLYTVDGKAYYSTGNSVSEFGCMYDVYDMEGKKTTYKISDDGTAQLVTFPLDEEFTEGKVNIFSWDNDLKSKVNIILEQYPEYKNKVVFWNIGTSISSEYIDFVNEQAAQGYASIFCLDTDSLYSGEIDLELFSVLENIGITEEDYKNSYAFVKKDGMVDGKLKFMSWQACPNVFVYNKEIAEKVFGTSDPKEIQALIATPEDFYAAAEKVKTAGYYMTSGVEQNGEIDKAIVECQERYTPISGAEDFIKNLNEKGYTTGSSLWSGDWFEDMMNGQVFGFFGTTWFAEGVIPENMYMVCEGPVNYRLGGTLVGISGTGNDKEGDAAAAFILEKLCCDEDIMAKIYEKYKDFPNNKKAVANLIVAGAGSSSNALNNVLSIFDASAREILAVKLVVEVERNTPKVAVSAETEDTLIETVFSDEEIQSGLYLEVKLTAEAIEITDVPTKEKGIIETAVKAGNMNIAAVIDLNIFKILGVDETKLTNLNSPVTITIDIPEKYRNSGYLFSVARLHDNKVDMLRDLDNNPDTVTFETDRFSLYTLTYSDVDPEPTETPTKVSDILFNNETVTAVEGDNFSINVTVIPADANNTKLTWSSSDTNVVVVDENGKVTAISAGNATIKASATDGSGVYKCCQVVIKPKPEEKPVDDNVFFAAYQGYKFYRDEAGNVTCLDSNGNPVINEFKCDGTYTYYFQLDGTAMRNRLTYHPDGKHVIYFDEYGHEVFSNFHHVEKSIAGDEVDDLCFFDVYGYMYVDVMTYDQAGEKLYYVNPYGVIEQGKWFEFSETCVWAGTTNKVGKGYGYANADGTLMINTCTYDWLGRFVYMQGDGHMQ